MNTQTASAAEVAACVNSVMVVAAATAFVI